MQEGCPLILIVDDEEHIGLLVSFLLKKAGYRTVNATSGQQALELWNPQVNMLLTDCTMPDIPGDQLALCLLERDPSLRVLFISGNSIESLQTSIALEPGVNFIQKPFLSGELLHLVKHALSD